MPVYEYLCTDCTQKFELFVPQRMSTEGVVCGRCHSASVRKLVSSFASVAGGAEAAGDFSAAAPATGGGCGCGGNCACGGH